MLQRYHIRLFSRVKITPRRPAIIVSLKLCQRALRLRFNVGEGGCITSERTALTIRDFFKKFRHQFVYDNQVELVDGSGRCWVTPYMFYFSQDFFPTLKTFYNPDHDLHQPQWRPRGCGRRPYTHLWCSPSSCHTIPCSQNPWGPPHWNGGPCRNCSPLATRWSKGLRFGLCGGQNDLDQNYIFSAMHSHGCVCRGSVLLEHVAWLPRPLCHSGGLWQELGLQGVQIVCCCQSISDLKPSRWHLLACRCHNPQHHYRGRMLCLGDAVGIRVLISKAHNTVIWFCCI